MKARGEIRPAAADAPERDVPPEFWENAAPLAARPKKKAVSLRVDQDVFDWFRVQGEGHLTRMNAVLRSYFEAQRDR